MLISLAISARLARQFLAMTTDADEVPDEYPDLDFDEPWDETLAQQELEDFEQADEYFGSTAMTRTGE